jgi:hypothetical protein
MTRWLLIAAIAAGCGRTDAAPDARTTYNAGLDLRENQHFEAAVRSFTEARAGAAGDGELRYRAAFELAGTLVAWAEVALADQDAEAAASRLQQAVAWYGDAARLRPDDPAARNNLQVAVTRLRALRDQLTAGNRALDKRLERVLADQRRIRDQLRQLDAALSAGEIEPAALDATTTALATTQRTLNAEVSAVGDLAAGERAEIEGDDQKQARVAQLSALLTHLDAARGAGGEVRTAIRRSLVPRAADRAEAAVNALVRAADQLLDPAALIRGLLGDQGLLARETRVIAALRSGQIELGDSGAAPEPPPHLAPGRLAARQAAIAERTGELAARLGAVASAGEADAAPGLASPFVSAAVAAMRRATESLGGDVTAAVEPQGEAMINLARALEYFANARGLIELTFAEQKQVVDRLGGDDRSAETREAIARGLALNRERLERLAVLLDAERESASKQLGDEKSGDEEARAAIAARFEAAERHRTAALARVTEAEKAGIEPARAALADLEELRRLFFSVVEHLKDLHRRQGETRDRTAAAQGSADDERVAVLGEIAAAQAEHLGLGREIAEALARQADEAQEPGAGDKLGAAADEVRQGAARMESAATRLSEAANESAAMSIDLEPPLADQAAAIDHLARAIEILEPPKQKDQQQQQEQEQQQQQQQQQQDQQQPQQGDQDLSQSEVEKRLRAIREREAERRRRRSEPRRVEVDRDW